MNKNQFIKTQLKIKIDYTDPTKVVNKCTYIRTKHTIVGPVKKLNCLNNVLCFFVLVKPYREKNNKK